MPILTATPYLILNGAAVRAIPFYEQALGAKTETLQRFGEVNQSCPEAQKHLVMHAELRVGEARLMMSDGPGEGAPMAGGAVSVALNFNDAAQLRRSFDALATQGQVIQPVIDAPWGDVFGVVSDQFGVSWMMTAPRPKA